MVKKCNFCNKTKNLSAYHNNKDTFDGKTTLCKACRNIKNKEYKIKTDTYKVKFSKNEEELFYKYNNLGYSAKKIAELMNRPVSTIYRKRKQEKLNTYFLYQKTTIEYIKDKINSGYIIKEIADELKCTTNSLSKFCKENGYNPILDYKEEHYIKQYRVIIKSNKLVNTLYNRYEYSAKIRALNFELNIEDFAQMIEQNCFYCEATPSLVIKTKLTKLLYNGIDRKNNKMGYTKDNCVPCCRICNQMKMDLDFNDFVEKCKIIGNRVGK